LSWGKILEVSVKDDDPWSCCCCCYCCCSSPHMIKCSALQRFSLLCEAFLCCCSSFLVAFCFLFLLPICWKL
jgi:hypothetical protein